MLSCSPVELWLLWAVIVLVAIRFKKYHETRAIRAGQGTRLGVSKENGTLLSKCEMFQSTPKVRRK